MEVGAALSIGVEGVPAGGYGSIDLDVVAVETRVEDERLTVAQHIGLEEREVGIALHRLLVDIVELHIFLVSGEHSGHSHFHAVYAQGGVGDEGIDGALQLQLLLGQFTYLHAVLRTFDLVFGRHGGVGGIELDGLGRVDGDIDNLAGYTQTVELGGVGGVGLEVEGTVFA